MADLRKSVAEVLTWDKEVGVDHFIIIAGLRDNLPLAAVAPLNEVRIRSDYTDKARIVWTLRGLADMLEQTDVALI
jgi:hypothetical protein